jgi:hypothetical protein
VTSVPARGPHADSANSAASRLLKNRFSYHNARYNDLARWNSSGLCRDATIPRDSSVGSWRRLLHLREYPSRAPATPHPIGRAACLETTARRVESTLPENAPSHFTLRPHICGLARRLFIAALGARNVKTASWKKVLKFARSRLSATTYRASAALRRSRLTCLPPWQLRIPKASVSQCR